MKEKIKDLGCQEGDLHGEEIGRTAASALAYHAAGIIDQKNPDSVRTLPQGKQLQRHLHQCRKAEYMF